MTDMLTLDGTTQPISEWALDYGIYPDVITDRLSRGWPVEQAITKPMMVAPMQRLKRAHMLGLTHAPNKRRQARLIHHDGLTLTIPEWAQRLNVPAIRLYKRFASGWSAEQAMSAPKGERQPGVVKNFAPLSGTGGGSTAQDIFEIEFSQ